MKYILCMYMRTQKTATNNTPTNYLVRTGWFQQKPQFPSDADAHAVYESLDPEILHTFN